MYNWNKIFNLVMEIKKCYIKKFNNISYDQTFIENTNNTTTCLENWIKELQNQEWIDIFSLLEVNQNNNLILIRYGNYSDVFGGEQKITNDSFWLMYDGIYKECRSVTIDVKNDILILCGFSKFQNVNETEENSLENIKKEISKASSVEITDKLDGSMQLARYVPEYKKIIMSGSQAIDVEQSWRLRDGYNILSNNDNYIKMINDNPNLTFIFEYISLKNAHVVCYTEEQQGMYLIGLRDIYIGTQYSYKNVADMASKYGVRMTTIFDKTLEELFYEVKNCKSNEKEGFVISIDGRLVKLKIDDYVQIHKILSKISSINLIIRSIANNEFDDLISKIPDAYKNRVNKIADIVFDYIKNMNAIVNDYFNKAPKDDRKTFMIWVDSNVEDKYIGYIKSKYLGKKINFIKSGNEKCPSYKRLNEMTDVINHKDLFDEMV